MRGQSQDTVAIMQLSPKSSATYGRTRTQTNTSWTAPSMSISDQASSARQFAPRAHRVPSQQSGGSSRQRYAAGSTFFNYETFGSLRPGQDWVRLFHPRYVGLAVHVTVCGFAFYFFSYGYGRLIAEYLKANDEAQVQAAHYVLVWPQALSLLIGLTSDCFPINGFRRKPYMIMGWLISITMYIVIIIMDAYGNSGRTLYRSEWKTKFDSGELTDNTDDEVSPFGIAYLLVSLVAAFGIQISWLSAISLSVEFAQREQLFHRGRLQATLVTLYYVGGVIANFVTACVIGEGVNRDHLVSTISVGDAAAILAVVSAIPFPFVLYYFYEEPWVNTTRVGMSVMQRLKNFWKFCHQNVVYRVLFFIILHLFLVGLYNQNVRDAVQRWSGVTRKEALAIECTRMVAMMLSILFWMVYLRNVSWRKLAFWGSVFYITVYAVLTTCAAFDWVRNEWFYGTMLSIADVARAWLILYAIILATEISDIGHEGVTVALAMSYQTLAGLAGYTLATIFPSVLGYKVTMDEVEADAPETRANVVKAFFIIAAINLTSFPLIRILPQQKLDAQQMRAFGGYNRYASTALLLTFAILLLFNLGINLVVVLR